MMFKLIIGVGLFLGGVGLLVYPDGQFFNLWAIVVILIAALIIRNALFPGK